MKMVRAVGLAAAIGAATAAGAAAQPVLGFRLGVSMSKASIEVVTLGGADEKYLMAFGGGGFIRFGAGTIALQPELMYVTKGIKGEDETTGREGRAKMDYVEVPVLLFLGLGTGTITPYLVVGPAFAIEVGCTFEESQGATTADAGCDETGLGEFERKEIDVSAMVGAGLAFPAGPGSITIDGRYSLGLINILDDTEPVEEQQQPTRSLKHRTFLFTAGYQIPLGLR